MDPDLLRDLLTQYPAFIFALVFHEFAHAWTATKLGDGLAAWSGRLTLDPRVHLDIIGSVVLPILGILSGGFLIGWAKPVPFNPRNLRDPVRDTMLIAAAGPVSNILLALAVGGILKVVSLLSAGIPPALLDSIWDLGQAFLSVNIVLAVFNMIPLPPLDGSKVLAGFLPPSLSYSLLNLPSIVSWILIISLSRAGVLRPPMTLLHGFVTGIWSL